MICDHELVLVGKASDAFEVGILQGDLRGNSPAAERLGQGKNVIQFFIRHLEQSVHFDNLDGHARGFILLAEVLHSIKGNRFAPLGEFISFGGRS